MTEYACLLLEVENLEIMEQVMSEIYDEGTEVTKDMVHTDISQITEMFR